MGNESRAFISEMSKVLKQAYNDLSQNFFGPPWYKVEGMKEHLIEKIKKMSPVEKALLGIED